MRIALVLAFSLVASSASAQIVNVQNVLGEDVREGFSGAVDASVDWRTGNVDLLLLSGAGTIRFKRECHFGFLTVRGDFGRAGDPPRRILARAFQHLRYRRTITEWLTGEVFAQNESDQFRRLRNRALLGVGPRFLLVSTEGFRLSLGAAYMIEARRIGEDAMADAGDSDLQHRLSAYVVAAGRLNDAVKVMEVLYAQPRFDDPGDVRVLSELSILSKLSSRFAFKTSFVVAYDASPPLGIEKLDTVLQSGLSATF